MRRKFFFYSILFLIILSIFPQILYGHSIVFSEEEKNWMKKHPVIRFSLDPEFKPIEFIDEKGHYGGITADYIRLIEKKIPLRFKLVLSKSWTEVLEKIKSKEVDMIGSVVKTCQREEFMLFSEPFLVIPSVLITRKTVNDKLDLEDLIKSGALFSAVEGYCYVDIFKEKYPHKVLDLSKDIKTALRRLSFGFTDVFISDLATAVYYIHQEGITNLKILREIEPPNISGFGIRKDWPILQSIINKVLKSITPEEKKAIHSQWISIEIPSPKHFILPRFFIYASIGLVLVIVIFVVWNIALKRTVLLRTKELVTAKEIAEKANHAKNQFLSNMSHELRTPLNGIIGGISLLYDSQITNEQKVYLEMIKISAHNLANIINDILEVTDLESGKVKLEETVIDLHEILKEVLSPYQSFADYKNIKLFYKIEEDVEITLIGDRNKIKRILNHLVSNAVKFTEKGEITVTVRKIMDQKESVILHFTVQDTGIGIPEDKLDTIFESFVQLDSSPSKKYGGTGLGLFICKKLVDMLGGVIKAESKIGVGSLFSFSLRLKKVS